MELIQDILDSDQSDLEKLRTTFERVTQQVIDHSQNEIEIQRALGDAEGVIRIQIKAETYKSAQSILNDCYHLITRATS